MNLNHGDFSIEVVGSIIAVELNGAFNEYGVRAFIAEVKSIIVRLSGKPFSILMKNLSLLGATPQAFEELNVYNTWLNTQNLIAKAVVHNSTALFEISKCWVPSTNIQNIKDFDNEFHAIRWLEQQS